MTENKITYPCPVCGEPLKFGISPYRTGEFYYCQCKRCGNFSFSDSLVGIPDFPKVRHLVSAWIRRQNKAGIKIPLIPPDNNDPSIVNWLNGLQYAGFPQTVPEKMDALLKAYAEIVHSDFNDIYNHQGVIDNYPWLISEAAAKSEDEIISINVYLLQMDYLQQDRPEYFSLTIKAWDRLNELSKFLSQSDSAFVAMWFDPCTEQYRKAVVSAISHCGYKPLIVDQRDFNGFIMDEVVSLIRQSKFLIADFTSRPENKDSDRHITGGVRGGVYWESGFAVGLGKPVIQTCEDNDEARERIHFDLQQYQTIFWKPSDLSESIKDPPIDNPNFAEKLTNRILSTLGRGTFKNLTNFLPSTVMSSQISKKND